MRDHIRHTFATGRGTIWHLSDDILGYLSEQQMGAWVGGLLLPEGGGGGSSEVEGRAGEGQQPPSTAGAASGSGSGKPASKKPKAGGKQGSVEADSAAAAAGKTGALEVRSSGASGGLQQLKGDFPGFQELHSTVLAYVGVSHQFTSTCCALLSHTPRSNTDQHSTPHADLFRAHSHADTQAGLCWLGAVILYPM